MKLSIFILVAFVVGFICDVVLNDLSKRTKLFSSLTPYYNSESITKLAIYSGIIISGATIILMLLFFLLFKKYLPTNMFETLMFFLIAYIWGYILDVVIDKTELFGKLLKPFYKEFGSGNSGAIAFIFALVLSLFIFKVVLV
jgi:hypothetical protein